MTLIGAIATAVYVAGVVLGLLVIDGRPAERVGLALVWPIGPIAFVITITILIAASLIAFPAAGAAAVLGGVVVWWALS